MNAIRSFNAHFLGAAETAPVFAELAVVRDTASVAAGAVPTAEGLGSGLSGVQTNSTTKFVRFTLSRFVVALSPSADCSTVWMRISHAASFLALVSFISAEPAHCGTHAAAKSAARTWSGGRGNLRRSRITEGIQIFDNRPWAVGNRGVGDSDAADLDLAVVVRGNRPLLKFRQEVRLRYPSPYSDKFCCGS